MKIYILGPSGSGKSYLASRLAKIYDIPHIEVDDIWVKHGGPRLYKTKKNEHGPEKDKLRRQVRSEVMSLAGSSWVIDGNYSYIREALLETADKVILVSPSRHTAAGSLIKRQLTGEDRRRGYNAKDFIYHLSKATRSHNRLNKKLHQIAEQHSDYVVLRSRSDINLFLDKSRKQSR